MGPPDAPSSPLPKRYAFFALGVIFFANFLSYLDRQIVSALENELRTAFRLSEVLLAADRGEEAAAAAERAVDRYEAKGNLVSAARARRLSAFPGARA